MKTTTAPTAAAPVNFLKVGEGATLIGYSDRHAYTVIAVTRTTATLQRDKATLLNGRNSGEPDALTFTPGGFLGQTEGVQRYAYERDPEGQIVVARLKRKMAKVSLTVGEYFRDEAGTLVTHKLVSQMEAGSKRVIAGRHEHYDFNF